MISTPLFSEGASTLKMPNDKNKKNYGPVHIEANL